MSRTKYKTISIYLHMYPFSDTVWTGNDGPHCINHDEITSFNGVG